MLENLNKYQVLLASKSPRRRELMSQLRVPFSYVNIGGIKEDYPADMKAIDVPLYLSRLKAEAYRERIVSNELIITADTVVINNGHILGKPKDRDEARAMLRNLSGHTHEVATGVTITTADRIESFVSCTKVTFATLEDEEIEYYLDNFQPYDKAGSYGIQEWIGCVAVEGIEGSFYNVMGLPVHRLYRILKSF